MINQPSLVVNYDAGNLVSGAVDVHNLNQDLMASLGSYIEAGGVLQCILQVKIIPKGESIDENLPSIFGRYLLLEKSVRFVPHFPFEPGLSYRASFNFRPFNLDEPLETLILEFSLPKAQSVLPTEVKNIFPSSDCLPENLLRFYISFSNSMQRGRAETEITIVGPDGEPAPDVLYRAPVELWDRSMRYLTVLLDPGRLKRGVGPNRELGPPLSVGVEYKLSVASGMVDLYGRRLRETFYKRFRVKEASRKHISVDEWKVVAPVTKSREPLTLTFPAALDWALLRQTISIVSEAEELIEGLIYIDCCESRWSFVPTLPWVAGYYQIRVASSLEDVCGNSLTAAFDRPLRTGSDFAYEMANCSISFKLD